MDYDRATDHRHRLARTRECTLSNDTRKGFARGNRFGFLLVWQQAAPGRMKK